MFRAISCERMPAKSGISTHSLVLNASAWPIQNLSNFAQSPHECVCQHQANLFTKTFATLSRNKC